MTTLQISNRKYAQAINRGVAQVYLPWPAFRLGNYGSRMFDGAPVTREGTDRAMDLYVAEVLTVPSDLVVIGVCAGRTRKLQPVIVVTLANRMTL